MSTVTVFLCPSEINSKPYPHDYGLSGVTNYGLCGGDWFVWGGFNGPQNRHGFGPNRSRQLAEFGDGLSNTLFAAEVKAHQTASNCRFTPSPRVTTRETSPALWPTPSPSPPSTTMAAA